MKGRESMRGAARRVVAVLTLVLAAAPLAWNAGGCTKEQQIMPAQPMPANLMDLPTVLESIRSDARPWRTLDADCSVVIQSPQLNLRGNQVSFVRGRLQIEKPGKIKLEAVEGQRRISLVGDGSQYRVDLPVFNDGYQGKYGDPLPVQPRRILVMPDDVVTAWDWSGLFTGKVPVLRNLVGGSVIDLLDLVSEPEPSVQASSEVAFDRRERRITSAEKYAADGAVRVQILVRAVDTVEGPDKQPVRVPRLVRITYPISWTAIEISLRHIKLNEEFPKGTFDRGS